MVKLSTIAIPELPKRIMGVIDYYYHPRLGIIARKWPRYNSPANTAGWKASVANLKEAWDTIRTLPDEDIAAWSEIMPGSQKTVFDQLRSMIMTTPPGGYPMAKISSASAVRSGPRGPITVYYSVEGERRNPTMPAEPHETIIYGPTPESVQPRWLNLRPPLVKRCRRRERIFPSWPEATGRQESDTTLSYVQSGITKPDTYGWRQPPTWASPTRITGWARFEDSQACTEGGNPDAQSCNAVNSLTFAEPVTITARVRVSLNRYYSLSGGVSFAVNGLNMIRLVPTDEGLPCQMFTATATESYSFPAGTHRLFMLCGPTATSRHKGMYVDWRIDFSREPTTFQRSFTIPYPYDDPTVCFVVTDKNTRGFPRQVSIPCTVHA